MLTRSPGTSSLALISFVSPPRFTIAVGASAAFKAATAFPAECSSTNPTVAFTRSRIMMPRKSSQSGGPSGQQPFATPIATIAAASITQERGFHINDRNCRTGFTFFSRSSFRPNKVSLCWTWSSVKPSSASTCRAASTSERGTFTWSRPSVSPSVTVAALSITSRFDIESSIFQLWRLTPKSRVSQAQVGFRRRKQAPARSAN
mmetsp:Transcript_1812/g.6456  ORF Transcript_1812/g.6456 Transcript_1812/m.6456 type:complete len:204 (-) Transcript_1812:23-634(-)